MKRLWIPLVLAGLSLTSPVFAHDVDWRAAGALRGGNPDLDHNGWVGPHDRGRMRREAIRREEIRRHMAARAVVKYRMYHRARAHAYEAEARRAAARADAHRAHTW